MAGDPAISQKYIASMAMRLKEVRKNFGYPTKY
jgi:hypothetical protein